MTNNHGGARQKAGRKPLDPNLGRRAKMSVTVRQSHKDALLLMDARTRAKALDTGLQIAIHGDLEFKRVLIEYAPEIMDLIQGIATSSEHFASEAANILSRMNASISD